MKTGEDQSLYCNQNKYNPNYNLQTMFLRGKTAKLEPRGNMTNNNAENNSDNKCMNSTATPGAYFEIHVKGHLDESWSDWLEGLEVKLLDNGEMILMGLIRDQAALIGMLNKLNGLNLTLLSLEEKQNKKEKK